MSDLGRPSHHAAVRHDDRLVAQADTEGRDPFAERLDVVDRVPGVLGGSRAGGDDEAVGGVLFEGLLRSEHIVAQDDRIGAELTQVLDQVEGERVVVVEDEDLHPTVPPLSKKVEPTHS